jgi:hypothetical protein
MSSSNDYNPADRNGAPTRAGQETLIARARVLIADPEYPTEAIVEELAELLLHGASGPAGG